jgi:hypothetical protein
MEVYEAVEAQTRASLTSRLDGERSVSRSDCINPEEVQHDAHWIGGWWFPELV